MKCENCNLKLTKKELLIKKRINDVEAMCYCAIAKEIGRKDKKILRLKKEVGMLDNFISEAQPEGWDLDLIYKDALTVNSEGGKK